MSIDTTNSKEMMAGSHITELHTHKYEESVPPDLLDEVPNVPQVCDSAQKHQLDSSNNSKDSNILSETNNATHTQKVSISQVKKIKTTTINMINNSLFVNMMVVKNTTINVINNSLLVNTMVV